MNPVPAKDLIYPSLKKEDMKQSWLGFFQKIWSYLSGTEKSRVNAEKVDGFDASETPAIGEIPVVNESGNLAVNANSATSATSATNADTVDNYHAALSVTASYIPVRTSEKIIEQCWNYIKLSDVQSSGTVGGAFTSGAWRTRIINTEDSDTGSNCSISSNQITLDAGTYECSITAPGYSVDAHKARLQNITDTATTLLGSSAYANSGNAVQVDSIIVGRFTIAAQKTFEVQHRCVTSNGTNGLGVASGFGVSEIYTVAEFWKVA